MATNHPCQISPNWSAEGSQSRPPNGTLENFALLPQLSIVILNLLDNLKAPFLIPSTKGELKPFAYGKHDSFNDVCPQDMLFNSEINENVLSFMILFYANAYSMDIDFSSIN